MFYLSLCEEFCLFKWGTLCDFKYVFFGATISSKFTISQQSDFITLNKAIPELHFGVTAVNFEQVLHMEAIPYC